MEDALSSARAIALAEAADERRHHEAAAQAKALVAQKLAVVDDKHHRHEAAAHATALAAKVLADKQGGQELAVHTKVFAGNTSAATGSKYSLPRACRPGKDILRLSRCPGLHSRATSVSHSHQV